MKPLPWRVPLAALCASVIAVACIAVAGYCFPLCAIYNDSNPEWYVFACWSCEG